MLKRSLQVLGHWTMKVCYFVAIGSGYSYLWTPYGMTRSRDEYDIMLAFDDMAEVHSRTTGDVIAPHYAEWRDRVVPVDWTGQC